MGVARQLAARAVADPRGGLEDDAAHSARAEELRQQGAAVAATVIADVDALHACKKQGSRTKSMEDHCIKQSWEAAAVVGVAVSWLERRR